MRKNMFFYRYFSNYLKVTYEYAQVCPYAVCLPAFFFIYVYFICVRKKTAETV